MDYLQRDTRSRCLWIPDSEIRMFRSSERRESLRDSESRLAASAPARPGRAAAARSSSCSRSWTRACVWRAGAWTAAHTERTERVL